MVVNQQFKFPKELIIANLTAASNGRLLFLFVPFWHKKLVNNE